MKKSPYKEKGRSEREKAYLQFLRKLKEKDFQQYLEAMEIRQRMRRVRMPIAKGLKQAIAEQNKKSTGKKLVFECCLNFFLLLFILCRQSYNSVFNHFNNPFVVNS